MPRLFGFLSPEPQPPRSDRSPQPERRDEEDTVPATDRSLYSAHEGADCSAPYTLRRDGLIVGLSGAPVWRGVNVCRDTAERALQEIASGFRETGSAVLDNLEGAFSLAVLEPAQRRAMLAIDRMGIESLAWTRRAEDIVFGNSAGDVARFASSASVRDQALFDFLFLHVVPAPGTVYQGVMKLPLATVLHFENGRTRTERYWVPRYRYARPSDFPRLKSALRQALESGVRAANPDDLTGAYLSGGLDSSSVSGMLKEVTGAPARTFTVGFGDSEHDELRFARIATRHFDNRAFEYQMRPEDIVAAFPRIAAAYDEPFGNSSAAPTYFCAKLAADNGITHVLAGDGGDELFGGNERYVRHQLFEYYGRLPKWLRRSVIEPITRLVQPEGRIVPLSKVRSYVDQARIPLPDRFESWNYMYREGGQQMLEREFASSIDPEGPLIRLREIWNSAPSDELLEKMLWYDWQLTLADNDLRKVNTMSALAGVRVSFPMLHRDVVDVSLQVPPDMKIEGRELRSFYKRAMADFLPEAIIRKKKHGFALPFGAWMKTNATLADLFYSHLSDLKKRRIVSAAFIDNLIEQHREGHPSYYGYAIWDLAMLDAWLACHGPG